MSKVEITIREGSSWYDLVVSEGYLAVFSRDYRTHAQTAQDRIPLTEKDARSLAAALLLIAEESAQNALRSP
jgi:hypothetical protein